MLRSMPCSFACGFHSNCEMEPPLLAQAGITEEVALDTVCECLVPRFG